MLENLFNLSVSTSSLSLPMVVTNLVLAFILSLTIALVYRNTHRGLSYSQSFTFTLVLIGLLISVIMMVIGNSLAIAFGAFGAFSLIRFRTAIKDTKDIAFILLAVVVGLAVGTGNSAIAIITTIFVSLIIYGLTRVNFGSIRKYDYILNFSADTGQFSNDKIRDIFGEFLKYDNLLNVVSKENGRVLDYSFNIKFINTHNIDKFINKLNQSGGISHVDIISAKNDIEY